MDCSSASSWLSPWLHHSQWIGDHGLSLLSFPTPGKWAHDIDDINVNLLRFANAAENPVCFTGPPATEMMGSESTENSKSRHCSRVLGSCMVG